VAVELGPLLGTGKVAEVYAWGDDLVLKLYKPGTPKSSAFREAANLSIVEASGLPVPRVHSVGGELQNRWGVMMTRAEGVPFASALMASQPSQPHLAALAALHRRIHDVTATQLPSLKARLRTNIGRAPQLDAERRERLLAQLATLPDGDRLCHGDFHPWNVLGTPEQATVIDWLDATSGVPAADVCRSYVLIAHASVPLAKTYVETYAKLSGLDVNEVWRWRPVVAGARLAEGVPDEEASLLKMVGAG
jgi:aminoglycoside phosphotransferase (APT) family kinase protein